MASTIVFGVIGSILGVAIGEFFVRTFKSTIKDVALHIPASVAFHVQKR